MRNIVYRFKNSEYWRIPEYESWLAYMASEGLHLKEIGAYRLAFERGKPKKMIYRLDITESGWGLDEETKEKYLNQGWEWVSTYDRLSVLRADEGLGLSELYTTPKEQEEVLYKLHKSLASSAVLVTVLTGVIIAMLASMLYLLAKRKGLALMLMEGMLGAQCLVVGVQVYQCYKSINAVIYTRRLIKRLQDSKHLEHRVDWRKWRRRFKWEWWGAWISVLFILLPLVGGVKPQRVNLVNLSGEIPIVRLEAIEQRKLDLMKWHDEEGINQYGSYQVTSSLWAKKIYESIEVGKIPEDKYSRIELEMEIYELRLRGMAKMLVKDLMNHHTTQSISEQVRAMEGSNFDEAWSVKTANRVKIFVRKAHQVYYLNYLGDAKEEQVIEACAENLSKNELIER